MNMLFIFAAAGFILWVLRNTLFWVGLWQVKEYRFDRLFVHLKDTRQGRNIIFSPLNIVKLFLIFAYGYTISQHDDLEIYRLFTFFIFATAGFLVFKEYSSRLIKRPVWTYKAMALTVLTILFEFSIFLSPIIFEGFFWLLIVDRILPFLVAFFIVILSFPTEFYQDIQIKRAINKLNTRRKLLVIGVTGSYGKSSTKEYTAQILKKEFRVLKTKGTNNTTIGVANTIVSGLKENTEIFVVEMGAYKIGEIAQICQIVRPKIGVLTAVSDQHLSLFGSLANTMKAKYELIDSLPKDGLALFNGNNENAYELYKKTKKRKVLYVCTNTIPAEVVAAKIKINKTYIEFDVFLKGKKIKLRAPLLGIHNIENILPGIYLADYLGVSEDKIKKAVSELTPLPKTMVPNDVGGITMVDDTFNSNPMAVMAAVDYMKLYEGKKIMVMQPMIELGKQGDKEHYQIGRKIASLCNYLLLTNKNYYSYIEKGVADSGKKCKIIMGSFYDLAKIVGKISKKGDVVVFEGKEAGIVLDKIL